MSVWRKVSIGASVFGVVLAFVGAIIGFVVLPNVVHDKIILSTKLEAGSDQYSRFVELPFPLDFRVFFFHIENADKISTGAKPIVKEIGPYTYSKITKKTDLTRDDRLGTISYQSSSSYKFNPAKSMEKDETKKIVALNVPLVVLFQTFENLNVDFLNKMLMDGYEDAFKIKDKTQPFFHEIEVGDYTFGSYKFCGPTTNTKAGRALCALLRLIPSESLEILKDRSIGFSFFRSKQNMPDGPYKVNSGMKDISLLGEMLTWKQQDRLQFWDDQGECNKLQGTDSTIYPPFNKKDDIFYIFNTDICRTVRLKFQKEVEFQGIAGYRNYLGEENMYVNTPETKCYCIRETRNLEGKLECFPNGFLDMKHCLGAPLVMSLPHFMWADKSYRDTVDGLKPDEAKHETFIDMEPNTGSPLRGAKRMQFNMVLRNYGFDFQVKPAMLPLIWVEEGVQITDSLVDDIKDQYVNQVHMVDILRWTLIGLGIAMFIGFAIAFVVIKKKIN